MSLILRYMQPRDLDTVVAIDNDSFDAPWPRTSYEFEIHESLVSHMTVLENPDLMPSPTYSEGIRGMLEQLRDRFNLSTPTAVLGYGGLWKIEDEAHISTIAVHEDYRGSGYGDILVVGMMRRSIALNASYLVLEVAVGNTVAQSLYQKYGFREVGLKRNYYRATNEDAYEMRVDFDFETVTHIESSYLTLKQRHNFDDYYTQSPHPRTNR